ncbi:MAG: hypothetical protein HXS52_09325 [Theionarchaea archaeon]|nr:hypothetical protein [Theionarchaea archaeon]MBU7038122.1 hypothetical protein [Theionarchaea archaeon]
MTSTVIFVLAENRGIPRTLSVQRMTGDGKIFLDASTIFYPEWQFQLRAVSQLIGKVFDCNDYDFLVSVDSDAVDGWSTSVPLFLLLSSAVTGEELPKNVFSTGCMFSPDGWISHGRVEAVQAKIHALEVFSQENSIQVPTFLIPFSLHKYRTEAVHLHYVTSMFSALKTTLPHTFESHSSQIENLTHVRAQRDLCHLLDYIPDAGDVFVLVPTDEHESSKSQKTSPDISEIGGTPCIKEQPLSGYMSLYFIRNNRVLFKHRYTNADRARADASQYQEVLHEVSR